MTFFPSSGPVLVVPQIGFRLGAKGTHTSRTMMFEEIQQVIAVSPSEANRLDYARSVIEGNCLVKPTVATRRLSNQRLGELYGLDPSIPMFRVFLKLWNLDTEARRLLAMLISIARDPLLAATAPSIVLLPINTEFQRSPMKTALQALVGERLNDSTLDKVCRNAASSWSQSGHLEGRTFKKRRSINATPTAVAFAIYLSHAAGFRGAQIFSSAWMQVLDCDPSRARYLTLEAKRIGLLDLRMSGDIVELNLSRLDPSSRGADHGTN